MNKKKERKKIFWIKNDFIWMFLFVSMKSVGIFFLPPLSPISYPIVFFLILRNSHSLSLSLCNHIQIPSNSFSYLAILIYSVFLDPQIPITQCPWERERENLPNQKQNYSFDFFFESIINTRNECVLNLILVFLFFYRTKFCPTRRRLSLGFNEWDISTKAEALNQLPVK